jgi:hypothetical protein
VKINGIYYWSDEMRKSGLFGSKSLSDMTRSIWLSPMRTFLNGGSNAFRFTLKLFKVVRRKS